MWQFALRYGIAALAAGKPQCVRNCGVRDFPSRSERAGQRPVGAHRDAEISGRDSKGAGGGGFWPERRGETRAQAGSATRGALILTDRAPCGMWMGLVTVAFRRFAPSVGRNMPDGDIIGGYGGRAPQGARG